MFKLNVKGSVFTFMRLSDGQGFWICEKGKIPNAMGYTTSRNTIVPADFGMELTAMAIEQGIGKPKDFARTVETPKYAPVHIAKEPKIKNGMIKFAFNPFKMTAPVAA
jgi:hypothetical protein